MDAADPSSTSPEPRDDTGAIVRFMVVKAAIFILVPAIVAAAAVIILL
ncbi:phosphoribosylformylglycinamidine synthase-associated small membrane protein [Amorphus sp. 3PC139-8]